MITYENSIGKSGFAEERQPEQYGRNTMFRPIRKKKNEIRAEDAKDLLRISRRGVLAVNGDDGYPYAIPINYIYDEEMRGSIFTARV